jgi:hypothetical protein
MTPAAATARTRRLVLVAAEPRRTESAVRRFRLARLQLEGREVARAERFDHVRRSDN